ncbi:MAG: tetratricopeptide repeat protein [Treponema sp.]|nr:tetratricopeptide repeat protein [Treponema sp.]
MQNAVPQTAESVPVRFIDKLAAALLASDMDKALALFDELSAEEAAEKQNLRLKASVLLSAGKLDDAREITAALTDEDGNDVDSLFILSNIERASGNVKKRKLILEKILNISPDFTPALNDLGQICIESKSLKQAAAYFDRALAASPDDMGAMHGRANTYRMEHKNDEAEALFNKAVELYPERGEPYSERGRFYRETGKPKQALSDLDVAKEIDTQNYWIFYDRGRALLEIGKKADALEEFDYAAKLNPDIFISYVYSAGIRDELEDIEGAGRDYETLTRLCPDYYFAFEGLGSQLMKQRRYTEAAKAFYEAYKKAPKEYNYAMLTVVNMLKGGGKHQEIKPFMESVMKNIDHNKLDYYVARLFFDFSGDSDVVRRVNLEKNPRTKAQMLFYLGNYYDIRGSAILANKFFQKFHELQRMDLVEWRLNEWIIKERGIQLGGMDGGTHNKG